MRDAPPRHIQAQRTETSLITMRRHPRQDRKRRGDHRRISLKVRPCRVVALSRRVNAVYAENTRFFLKLPLRR